MSEKFSQGQGCIRDSVTEGVTFELRVSRNGAQET